MNINPTLIRELYGHLMPGDTARRNHDDCPSGEDRRRRLYVTKSDDNSQLKCYCHNCGTGTVVDTKAPRLRRVVKPEEPEELKLPPQWRDDKPLHPRHVLWLKAYGILDVAEKSGVYSMSEYELVFPYHDFGTSELSGYQIRHFDGRKPKWKSKGRAESARGAPLYFLVEDIVSAMKLNAATGNGYVCLCGHNPNRPVRAHSGAVIWLDNDKPSVIEAAETLAKNLGPHGDTILIEGGTDPKRYPKHELIKVKDVCEQLVKSPPADGRPYHVLKIRPPNQGVCD